jgi:hypothetical protein
MINRQRQEVDKIFQKIDKIAKRGTEYFKDYSTLIDEYLLNGKYSELKECLTVFYHFDANNMDVSSVKKESWPIVRFYTNSSFQEQRQKMMKTKGVYQVALDYYKEIPLTRATVKDTSGTGAELLPVTENGGVYSMTILRQGQNYSASASITITGGIGTASATPVIKSGRINSAIITATGSGHNQTLKIGRILEIDEFEEDITNKLTKDQFQRLIQNKKTYLVVTKDSATQSFTFSSWNINFTYEKNLLKLYTEGINYLLS